MLLTQNIPNSKPNVSSSSGLKVSEKPLNMTWEACRLNLYGDVRKKMKKKRSLAAARLLRLSSIELSIIALELCCHGTLRACALGHNMVASSTELSGVEAVSGSCRLALGMRHWLGVGHATSLPLAMHS